MKNKFIELFSLQINNDRNFGLDILRAFAILFVLIGHGAYQLPENIHHYNKFFYIDGVSLFFVLSGFLIGGIFIKFFESKNLKSEIFNFWLKRWIRTIPAYYFILTIVVIVHYFAYKELNIKETVKHYLFIQNFFIFKSYLYPEAWSLSIEEWFYIIMPLTSIIFFEIFKTKRYAFLLFIIIMMMLPILLRYYNFYNIKNTLLNDISMWDEKFRSVTIFRLDNLIYGVLAAYLNFYKPESFFQNKNIKFIIGLLILLSVKTFEVTGIAPYNSLFQCVFSFSINSIGVFLIIPFLVKLKKPKNNLLVYIVTFISLTSYSMYLINSTPIQTLFLNRIIIDSSFNYVFICIIKYITYWILTFILSLLTYKLIELPFLELRNKYIK